MAERVTQKTAQNVDGVGLTLPYLTLPAEWGAVKCNTPALRDSVGTTTQTIQQLIGTVMDATGRDTFYVFVVVLEDSQGRIDGVYTSCSEGPKIVQY